MNEFENVSKKYNFKKIVKWYIVFFIVALLLSGTFLGYAYKDKLLFAYNYNKISERIQDGEIEIEAIKPEITSLAKNSDDVIDILILDDHNKVSFSAKDSYFGHGSEFILEPQNHNENQYLNYVQNPEVSFKLMKKENLILSSVLFEPEKQIQSQYKDDTFFEDNSNMKKIYLLSYIDDKASGDKIYVISDIHPVENSQSLIGIVGAVFILLLMSYLVLVAFWVYQDARKSKINATLWGIITLCTNLAGLFIYLIYKQNSQVCYKCGALQNKINIYCVHCGTKINKTCKGCSSITSAGDSFCHHCGNEIDDI